MGDLMSDLEMSCEDAVLKFEVLCFMSNADSLKMHSGWLELKNPPAL